MEAARRAIAGDRDSIVELAERAVAELAPTRGGPIWARREARLLPVGPSIDADLGAPDVVVFVGTFEELTVGYAIVRVEVLRDGGRLAVVDDLYVQPEARGVSVGEAMMDLVIEWSTEQGCIGIDAFSLPGQRETKNFFERFGLTARAILVHRSLTADEETPVSDAPELCVSALVVEEDQLLLVQRANAPYKGEWAIPGGRVKAGETLAEAVVRELEEETGIEGVCGEYMGLAEVIDGDHHSVILDFRVYLMDFAEPTAGDDAADARWVPLGDVTDLRLVPGVGEFLHDHGIISTYC